MSLIGKRVVIKDGDTLLIVDKVLDKLGKDGPIIDKYVAVYGSGRVTTIAPFQIDAIAVDKPKTE